MNNAELKNLTEADDTEIAKKKSTREPKDAAKKIIKNNICNPCQSKSKSKVLILADSHGRHCANILNTKLNSNQYQVESIFKPNVVFEDVILDITKLTMHFSKNDFVFILGGTNDVLKGRTFNTLALSKCIDLGTKTNVVFVSVPYVYNRPILNKLIYNYNSNLVDNINKSAIKVNFLDVNKYLRSVHFNIQGIHLNKLGKFILCSVISDFLSAFGFVSYGYMHDFEVDPRYIIHDNLTNVQILPTVKSYEDNLQKNKDIVSTKKLYPDLSALTMQELLLEEQKHHTCENILNSPNPRNHVDNERIPEELNLTDFSTFLGETQIYFR